MQTGSRFEGKLSSEILISSDPWENRVAILEDGEFAELYIEREEKVIGSIYKGKVQNVLPGMGAAFVDIGLGRNAFLYVDDINKQPLNIGDVEITQGHSGFTISEKVKRGDDVLVQIVKEPRGLKGARISTNISLPGRYLILMPTGRYSGVSRKIESADERNRLKSVMKRIRPEGMATVVRTAASGVSEAELIADLGVLIRMWHGILETYKRAAAPSLLHKDMNLVYKAARDFITADVDRVLIDDEEEYRKVRHFLQLLGPQYIDRVEYYNSGRSLFDDYKIEEELQKLMRPKINLPSGASIVIESTEALTVIDVNSGKFTGGRNLEDTILKTNIEAAEEIARQVRLRDIGGIIVVDFIDMSSEASRNKVVRTMEEHLRRDRTRATIQSFSNLRLARVHPQAHRQGSRRAAARRVPHLRGHGQRDVVAVRRDRDLPAHFRAGDSRRFGRRGRARGAHRRRADGLLVRGRVPGARAVDRASDPRARRSDDSSRKGAHRSRRLGRARERTRRARRRRTRRRAAGGTLAERHVGRRRGGRAPRRGRERREQRRQLRAHSHHRRRRRRRSRARRAGDRRRRSRAASAAAARAELTAAEQTRQLRELAEDAARQSAARPPIGISAITEEEEAQDKELRAERKGEAQPDAIIIGQEAAQHEGDDAHRKRRRRRRGRGGRGRGNGETSVATTVDAGARTAAAGEPTAGRRRRTAPPTPPAGTPRTRPRRRGAVPRCPTVTSLKSGPMAPRIRPAPPRPRNRRARSRPSVSAAAGRRAAAAEPARAGRRTEGDEARAAPQDDASQGDGRARKRSQSGCVACRRAEVDATTAQAARRRGRGRARTGDGNEAEAEGGAEDRAQTQDDRDDELAQEVVAGAA